jgi:integrase/recombinase XerD
LAARDDGEDADAPLFIGRNDRRMNPTSLRLLLTRMGKRAGVPDCHPHRMRHTFALEFLRGGGDVFSLQKLLGHSTLDMVRNYVAIAQVDVQNAHRRASPVDRWRL